jgi:hypothetical protein
MALERIDIFPVLTDVIATMLHAVDDLDWETVRSCFTTEVEIDYTSLWGGEPETLTADELIDRWQQLLPGFDATQHLIGPVAVTEVDELTASCTTNVRGYHRVGDATWMVAGRYDMRLERVDGSDWRIAALRLRHYYDDGDRGLVEVATKRAVEGAGRATRSG